MARKTLEELNQADAAKIERRRRMLARGRDPVISDLETAARLLRDYAERIEMVPEGGVKLLQAAEALDQTAMLRIDQAVPKIGGAQ